MMGDDLGLAIRSGQRDVDLPVEQYEHIDLTLTASEERDVCRKGLLSSVGTHALDHLLREFGECEVRTKVWSVPCTGLAVSVIGHSRRDLLSERINPILESVVTRKTHEMH